MCLVQECEHTYQEIYVMSVHYNNEIKLKGNSIPSTYDCIIYQIIYFFDS